MVVYATFCIKVKDWCGENKITSFRWLAEGFSA
jgi:hypothetical protein